MAKHLAEKTARRRASSKGGRRPALPLILIVLGAALLVLTVYILRRPDIGYIGNDSTPAHLHPESGADGQPSADFNSSDGTDDPASAHRRTLTPKNDFYTFLLAGTNDSYNTDTMMLCSVDTAADKVNMISVPRDSMVDRDTSIPKINGAYGRGGVEEMCAEVTELTGVPINYYCVINTNAFVRLIDTIGGVYYNVPFDMYHPDAQEEYTIDLHAGPQTLNGHQAQQFCRFRGTSENDFGRMNRQKDFLLETLRQVRSNFSISQIEDFISIFNENVKTNMSVRDMIWFYMNVLSDIDLSADVSTHTLPYSHTGKYKNQDYVYLDAAEVLKLVNETVNPYTEELEADDLHIICLED